MARFVRLGSVSRVAHQHRLSHVVSPPCADSVGEVLGRVAVRSQLDRECDEIVLPDSLRIKVGRNSA
jgi:hypothetical protein